MWQDQAWHEWSQRLEKALSPEVSRVMATMSREDKVVWLRRAERTLHPVAMGVAAWLSQLLEAQPWFVFPGDEWAIREESLGVLMSYPEYLGHDPLAMCALGALWAQGHAQRWARLVERLGPLSVLGPWQGRFVTSEVSRRLNAFYEAYASLGNAWNFRQMREDLRTFEPPVVEEWPRVPDYSAYRDQLLYGVVPHEVGGRPVQSEVWVLLALLEVPDDIRHAAAPLAYKALESLWLTQAWARYAEGGRHAEAAF